MNYINLLIYSGFLPRGQTFDWQPEVLWPQGIGDALLTLCFYLIPIYLTVLVKKQKDFRYPALLSTVVLFLLLCGSVHLLSLFTIWYPFYAVEGWLKLSAAFVSVFMTVLLVRQSGLAAPSSNQELREHNQKLETRINLHAAELLETQQDISRLTYALTHDLRLPLTNLRGLADALTAIVQEDQPEPYELRQVAQLVKENVSRMDQVMIDFMAFSHTGQTQLSVEKLDMDALARQAYDACLSLLPGKHDVDLVIDPLPPAWGDQTAISKVWKSLISNALKFSRHQPTIRLRISAQREERRLVYTVQDNGIGFDMAYQDKLFGLFQRLHDDPSLGGTGVGLATSRRILKKHGGRIWATGRPGAGATFYFSLPTGTGIKSNQD